MEVSERILRHWGSNELFGGGFENRVRRIEGAPEKRSRNQNAGRGVPDFAVAKARIVTPGTIKQFVALNSNGRHVGLGRVVANAIREVDQAISGTTGNDLLKRIERIERTHRQIGGFVGWAP